MRQELEDLSIKGISRQKIIREEPQHREFRAFYSSNTGHLTVFRFYRDAKIALKVAQDNFLFHLQANIFMAFTCRSPTRVCIQLTPQMLLGVKEHPL